MERLKRILGLAWAMPVTAAGLVYALVFWACRWHKWSGVKGDALVWQLDESRAPAWLIKLWERWAGHTVGNVIVLRVDPNTDSGKLILDHELEHVNQCMRMGVFQPVFYALVSLAIFWGCKHSDPYHSNCFELDARRGAGQLVDVESAKNSIKTMLNSRKK